MVLFWTEPFLSSWMFMEENLIKRKRLAKIVSKNKKNSEHIKNFPEKHKNLKAIWAVLELKIQNLKFSLSANHGGQHILETLAPPIVLVLLWPWLVYKFDKAASVLQKSW